MDLTPGWSTALEFIDRCPSTQRTLVARAHSGELSLTAISALVAMRQDDGMGRQGRTWNNPPGEALLMSVAAPGPFAVDALEDLPVQLARDVVDALTVVCRDGAVTPIVIEPPNDLMCSGRKVGGVLVDTRTTSDTVDWVVMGVGVNLTGDPFDVAGGGATTIAAEWGISVPRRELAQLVADRWAHRLARWRIPLRDDLHRDDRHISTLVHESQPAGAAVHAQARPPSSDPNAAKHQLRAAPDRCDHPSGL